MIFVGPYLSNPNCHFNMNVVDSIGNENDLIIDIKEEKVIKGTQYLIIVHAIIHPWQD